MRQLTHGSLFSGIGGFDLGFERAGFKTVWQVEIDPFCRKVLEKHWPDAQRFHDVRQPINYPRVNVITAGVPCQPISFAGARLGPDDNRWLWPETIRIIDLVRPEFAVFENPPALLNRGMGGILSDLAEIGFDAEWATMSACSMGAPHTRTRLFIVAYPPQERFNWKRCVWTLPASLETAGCNQELCGAWSIEPGVSRVAYGIPDRMDRIATTGNAQIPQIAEWIAQRIKAVMEAGEL